MSPARSDRRHSFVKASRELAVIVTNLRGQRQVDDVPYSRIGVTADVGIALVPADVRADIHFADGVDEADAGEGDRVAPGDAADRHVVVVALIGRAGAQREPPGGDVADASP